MNKKTTSGKIRILHVVDALSGGGAQTQLRILLNHIDHQQFENHICVLRSHGMELITDESIVHLIPRKNKFDFRLRKVHQLVKRVQPDIIHNWLPVTQTSVMPSYLLQKKKIICLNQYQGLYKIDTVARFVQSFWFLLGDKIVSNVIPDAMHQPFKKYYELRDGELLFQGYNIEKITSFPPTELAELGVDPDLPIIAFVGRFSEEKNVPYLLRGAAPVLKAGKAQLLLIGDGAERDGIEALVDELGIRERTIFAGFRNDVYGILQQCQMMVLCSFHEGMPNVMFEARVLRVPVIASHIKPHAYWTKDGENGFLVALERPAHLTETITKLIEDPALHHTVAENAFRLIEENVTLQTYIDTAEDLYNRLYQAHNS